MFLISRPALVLECCRNGIVGTLPALNNRTTEGLDRWLTEIEEGLKQTETERGEKLPPYGVNLIVHRTNPRLRPDLEVLVKHRVPIVITSLGAATEVIDAVHSYGGRVFHDVTNTYHAQKAIDAGVDGLILVTAGAGGHAGTLNPIPFVTEIRGMFDGVILLAGAISNGRDVATALQMGADLAYMGTRFINTQEAVADQAYKDMIIQSGSRDIVYTAAVSGIPANWLGASLAKAGIGPEMYANTKKIDLGEELDHEAKAWKNIYSAGHGVATIDDNPPAAELIARLEREMIAAIREQSERLSAYASAV